MKHCLGWLACVVFGLINTAAAQIDLSAVVVKSISGLESPQLVGDMVLVGPSSKPTVVSVGLISVSTDYKFFDIVAKRSLLDEAELVPVGDSRTQFLLSGEGLWLIQVTAFDPEKGIARKSVSLTIPPSSVTPPDKPDPPQPPDIPPGKFDAIAKESRKHADAVNDPPTRVALSAAILSAASSISSSAPMSQATSAVSSAIETTLLQRTGASRYANWNAAWRRPLDASLQQLQLTAVKDYVACMIAIGEALK